jgi:hexosaminidase
MVDLGAPQTISSVTIDVFRGEGSWIYLPTSIEVLVSEDGMGFASAGKLDAGQIAAAGNVQKVSFPARPARYVRVVAVNQGKVPEGKPGAGQDAWLFVDEIIVE